MHHTPYVYKKEKWNRYSFISTGKRRILKSVDFTPTERKDVYNLGFGDVKPYGRIDDIAISNNGDIIKIFVTVIDILQDFIHSNPSIKIYFCGSTRQRTALYNRILRTYYQSFSDSFVITGCIEPGNKSNEVPFDPTSNIFIMPFL